MTELLRGHLYRARLDKVRPVLVVSPDYRNQHASDVIVVPCTSRLREAPTHIRLRKGEGGVRQSTMLKCEQITTLHRDDVRPGAIGRPLAASRMNEVEQAILRAIGVPIGL